MARDKVGVLKRLAESDPQEYTYKAPIKLSKEEYERIMKEFESEMNYHETN